VSRIAPRNRNLPVKANLVYRDHLGLAYARMGKDALARQSLEHALRLKLPAAETAEARKTLASLK